MERGHREGAEKNWLRHAGNAAESVNNRFSINRSGGREDTSRTDTSVDVGKCYYSRSSWSLSLVT